MASSACRRMQCSLKLSLANAALGLNSDSEGVCFIKDQAVSKQCQNSLLFFPPIKLSIHWRRVRLHCCVSVNSFVKQRYDF